MSETASKAKTSTTPKAKMPTLADIVKINMLRQMEDYVKCKIKAHITRSHENMLRTRDKVPLVKEEAPTNCMGSSSSTSMTGNVDTFDPLLFRNVLKRKIAKTSKPVI